MLPKTEEKKEALRLRRLGHSLNEIATQLKVSKASASLWLRGVELSASAQKKILQKRRVGRLKSGETHHRKTLGRLNEAVSFAESVMSRVHLDTQLSQVLCALLYWCEGEKAVNDKTLTFANSDHHLIATFLYLLRKGFEINEQKFRVCLHVHDYHNEKSQIQFWSRITKIPVTQFLKPYHKPHTGKRVREGYAGCASIRYYDTRIARQVLATARAFLKKYGPIVQR